LLHSWYRDHDPLPHVAEHEFQSCHVPQFPFTKYIKWNIRKTITIEKSPKYNCLYCLNHHGVYKLPSTLNICYLSRFYHLWTDCCPRIFPKDGNASALLSTLLSISNV
jgi:hypothetical protein